MSRRAHQPDLALRRQVETLVACRIPETDISRVVSIYPKTLRKRYRAHEGTIADDGVRDLARHLVDHQALDGADFLLVRAVHRAAIDLVTADK
jgi:hypothetical protein